MSGGWIDACATSDLDPEEVRRFDHGDRTFAIYRNAADGYFATDGFCTHEAVHLADGYVEGSMVECPKHGGAFRLRDRAGSGRPRLCQS